MGCAITTAYPSINNLLPVTVNNDTNQALFVASHEQSVLSPTTKMIYVTEPSLS